MHSPSPEQPRFVDLHCHYIPGIDDGVRTQEEGLALCRELRAIGFAKIAATPHIRSAMFDNDAEDLRRRFAQFSEAARGRDDLPELMLGAEHFCDDRFWQLFESGRTLPYAGGKALLIELPPDRLPLGLDQRCFRLRVRGLVPVLAHPERYAPLFGSSEPIERLLELGMVALLDLMSLVEKYGRKPKRTAERMLEENVYFAACSDCHRPADVELVGAAIERLRALVGRDEAEQLLTAHPAAILRGEVER